MSKYFWGRLGKMTQKDDVVTLFDEEGKEHNFEVVDIIMVNDKDYAIMLPLNEAEAVPEEEEEAVIFRIEEENDEDQTLVVVEDEEEWNLVAEAWEDRLMEMEDEDDGLYEDDNEEEL